MYYEQNIRSKINCSNIQVTTSFLQLLNIYTHIHIYIYIYSMRSNVNKELVYYIPVFNNARPNVLFSFSLLLLRNRKKER